MSDQQPEAARENVDPYERGPSAIAAPAAAIGDGQKAAVQQHLAGDLLDIACEWFADRIGEKVKGGARFPRPRLDDGLKPSYPLIVEGVDEALGLGVDGPRDLVVHHRLDLPGDDVKDDASADSAEYEDRQREAKSGSAKELTERRHELCNQRREPC